MYNRNRKEKVLVDANTLCKILLDGLMQEFLISYESEAYRQEPATSLVKWIS